MRIFLIRHGESITNAGENYEKRIPDHLAPLTEKGEKQADIAGKWLAEYCAENGVDLTRARIWYSPFVRTKQTCYAFNEHLKIASCKENFILTEQQYGAFDALTKAQRESMYPLESAEYARLTKNKGRLYARPYMGESPFDVAIRIYQFIERIRRDEEKEGVDTLFIFTHGTVLRAFLLRWFDYTTEWFEKEDNPRNCYIREIDGDMDKGYVYTGEEGDQ